MKQGTEFYCSLLNHIRRKRRHEREKQSENSDEISKEPKVVYFMDDMQEY